MKWASTIPSGRGGSSGIGHLTVADPMWDLALRGQAGGAGGRVRRQNAGVGAAQTEPPASLGRQSKGVGVAQSMRGQATATFPQPVASHFCWMAPSTLLSFTYSPQSPQGPRREG